LVQRALNAAARGTVFAYLERWLERVDNGVTALPGLALETVGRELWKSVMCGGVTLRLNHARGWPPRRPLMYASDVAPFANPAAAARALETDYGALKKWRDANAPRLSDGEAPIEWIGAAAAVVGAPADGAVRPHALKALLAAYELWTDSKSQATGRVLATVASNGRLSVEECAPKLDA